jgi:hypothetical protein
MIWTFINRIKLLELKNGIWISNKLNNLFNMYFVGFVCSPNLLMLEILMSTKMYM